MSHLSVVQRCIAAPAAREQPFGGPAEQRIWCAKPPVVYAPVRAVEALAASSGYRAPPLDALTPRRHASSNRSAGSARAHRVPERSASAAGQGDEGPPVAVLRRERVRRVPLSLPLPLPLFSLPSLPSLAAARAGLTVCIRSLLFYAQLDTSLEGPTCGCAICGCSVTFFARVDSYYLALCL